jgi:peroxiredoxin
VQGKLTLSLFNIELMIMKKCTLVFIFLLSNIFLFGQSNVKKPNYVIIAGGNITTREKIDSLGKLGYIKSINKGVTEEERKKLFDKFGSQIGDKEFIVIIALYSDAERQQRQAEQLKNASKVDTVVKKSEYHLHLNDTVKNFAVKMINGEIIRLSDLKGKVVMVNFWATWCAPCLMEFYDFPSKIITPFKNSNFMLLPISRGESIGVVKAKMKRLQKDGISFNVGIDPTENIWKLFAEGSIPKSFLIDKKGVVRYTTTGNDGSTVDKLAVMIKTLLTE